MKHIYELFEPVFQSHIKKEVTNNLADSLQRDGKFVGMVNTQ